MLPCAGNPLSRAVASEAEIRVLYCLGVSLNHRLSVYIKDQGSFTFQTTIEKGEDIETKLDGGPASVTREVEEVDVPCGIWAG